jgi:hypothetical protein
MDSPSTFLPRTLFSDEDSDTDICSSDSTTEADSGTVAADVQPIVDPDDNFSTDDEERPLQWSGFHDQIEELLRTVQKPSVIPDNDDYSDPEVNLSEINVNASCPGSSEACSEIMESQEGTSRVDSVGSMQRSIHASVCGNPLPAWLVGGVIAQQIATDILQEPDEGCQKRGSQAQQQQDTGAYDEDSETASLAHAGALQARATVAHQKRSVPDWLVSPAKAAMIMRGSAHTGAIQSPFQPLIDEIEAHFAAVDANKHHAASLHDIGPSGTADSSMRWYTNEVASATAEEDRTAVSGKPSLAMESLTLRPPLACISNTHSCGAAGAVQGVTAAWKRPQQLEAQVAELDSLAYIGNRADVGAPEMSARNINISGGAGAENALLLMGSSPARVQQKATHWHSPARSQKATDALQDQSPVTEQGYRILRPSMSPQSVMRMHGAAMALQPAGQEKELPATEDGTPVSGILHAAGTPVLSMSAQRRILGELPIDTADGAMHVDLISMLQEQGLPEREICIAHSPTADMPVSA